MTSHEDPGTSIEHPSRRISDDDAAALRKFGEQDDAELAHRQKLAKLSRPTNEERRELSEIYQSIAQIDDEQTRTLRDISKRRADRVREEVIEKAAWVEKDLLSQPVLDQPGGLPEGPLVPHAVDHTFWWANSRLKTSSRFHGRFEPDGAHVFGYAYETDGDLMTESFQLEASFELQPDRIPESQSGRWLSTPHVELFGGFGWGHPWRCRWG